MKLPFRFALAAVFAACIPQFGRAQVIVTPPQDQVALPGGGVALSVTATGAGLSYRWLHNGAPLAGATSAALTLTGVQPANTGIYAAEVTSGGNSISALAALGLSSAAKVIGTGEEVAANIPHPRGNIYDQILLQGAAVSVTADPGQVTRTSYIDLNGDIVQIEFAGAGTLSLVLDAAAGPAAPEKYNQGVLYMRGHAGIVIVGADETTNVSVFSVGKANAVNQALFQDTTTYDGVADLAYLAIIGGNGKFGGIRTANANYFATRGLTGIYAPGVQFGGPVFVGDINAFDAATPMLVLGSAADTRITGGDLRQENGQALRVKGVTLLDFVAGSTSHGTLFAPQRNLARLEQDGLDITSKIAPTRPGSTLYVARLRPDSSAVGSTASGYATIVVNADGSARINVTFSNLGGEQTAAYLRIGAAGEPVLSLGLGQVSGRTWTYTATATQSSYALIHALNTGNISVGLESAKYPSGELRGSFIGGAAATGSSAFVPPAAPPALPAGVLTAPSDTDAARFLTQATFGPTLAEINALTKQGIPAWLDQQMALPASSHFAATRADEAAFPNPPTPATRTYFKIAWWNRRAAFWKNVLSGPDQLRQRVAWALSQIFVVGNSSTNQSESEASTTYYDLLVNGAFGNFRQLLEDVTLNPIMGLWLSHLQNQKTDPVKGTAPDENYAREVQQLFTIGLVQLHPDGTLMLDTTGQPIPTYTQDMVADTAKILTGWAFANPNSTSFTAVPPNNQATGATNDSGWLNPMRYYDAFHDKTAKRIVSLQQVAPESATPTTLAASQSGRAELKVLLDTLFNHPNTGPFICRQLIQRLVTSNPSPGYVYRAAQVFGDDGKGVRGNLGAVVRAILTDYEARSPDVLGNAGHGKIKEPILRFTAFLRSTNARAPNGRFLNSYVNDPRGTYVPAGSMVHTVLVLAQGPFDAESVFNFYSPDYSPPGPIASAGLVAPELQIIDASFALSAPGMIVRHFLFEDPAMLPAPPTGLSPFLVMDYSDYLPNARNPAALIEQMNLVWSGGQMSAVTKTEITTALQSLPATATDLERVRTAIAIAMICPDGAVQR